MKPTHLILNPLSGHGSGKLSLPRIRSLLDGLGVQYSLEETQRPWHAAELARAAAGAGAQLVVAVGGDGTANEVLNGLLLARPYPASAAQPAMGILPVGRGNDFAFAAGLPLDLEAACRALASGCRRRMDVGLVRGGDFPNGRYFGNGVGIGFDAVVGFEAAKMTRLRGFPNYIVAALKTIFLYYRAPQVRLQAGGNTLELSALMVSVMNGRRMGGGFWMAPTAASDDGLLDLCIARQVSRPRILALIPRFMKGTQVGHPAIQTLQTARLRIDALQGGLPAHADGETLCTHGQSLEIELLPGQIEMVCAAPENAA